MSFTLNSLSNAELCTYLERNLPARWDRELGLELQPVANELHIENFQERFQSIIAISYPSRLAMALVYSYLTGANYPGDLNELKRMACQHLEDNPELVITELTKNSAKESLIPYLVEFKDLVVSCEQSTNPAVSSQPLTKIYEPIAAVNAIKRKIILKLINLGYHGLECDGYAAQTVTGWIDFLHPLFKCDISLITSLFNTREDKIVDINHGQLLSLILTHLRQLALLTCSDKVASALKNCYLISGEFIDLELADFDNNLFSAFSYYAMIKANGCPKADEFFHSLFSQSPELLRPNVLFVYLAHVNFFKHPFDKDVILQLRQKVSFSLDFLNNILFQTTVQIETHRLILLLLSIATLAEKQTLFEQLNSSQQNYLQYINQHLPELFNQLVYEFSFLPREVRFYCLTHLDENQENILLYSLKNNTFKQLYVYLTQEFEIEFINMLLSQAHLSGQNIFSVVSDASFPTLIEVIRSKAPETQRRLIIPTTAVNQNILVWTIQHKSNRLTDILKLISNCDPQLIEEYVRAGFVSVGAAQIALSQSPESLVILLSFIKHNYPHLLFPMFIQDSRQAGIAAGFPLLIAAVLIKSSSIDYLLDEINSFPLEQRQHTYTQCLGSRIPALFFAIISGFRHKEILAACLAMPSQKMQTFLLQFPFNFDELLEDSVSGLMPTMTRTYFESLLELDKEDFVLSLVADKLIFNKSQSHNELIKIMLNHGIHLSCIAETNPGLVLNFNKFFNQLLQKHEAQRHILGFVKLIGASLNKPRGDILASNLSSVLSNLFKILVSMNQKDLFIELSTHLNAKHPAMLEAIIHSLTAKDLLKAHLDSGLLFLPLGFTPKNYLLILEKIRSLDTSERYQLLTKEQANKTNYLCYIMETFIDHFPLTLTLMDGFDDDQKKKIWLNEDEFGNPLILSIAQNAAPFLSHTKPYLDDVTLKTVFTSFNSGCKRVLNIALQLDNGSLESLMLFLGTYEERIVVEVMTSYGKAMQQHCLQRAQSTDFLQLSAIRTVSQSQLSLFTSDDQASKPSDSKRSKLQGK